MSIYAQNKQERARREDQGEDNFFAMTPSENAQKGLKSWLERRNFNHYRSGWTDRQGNPGIGLSLDDGKGNFQKMGVIVCKDDSLDLAVSIIEQHLGWGEQNDDGQK